MRDGSTEWEGGETTSIHKEPTTADRMPGSSEVTGLSQKVQLKDFVILFDSCYGGKIGI